jgi:hypothetical protein
MTTIQKVRNADCDGGGWSWVVCDDNDVTANAEWFDTEAEADAEVVARLAEKKA